MRYISSYLLLCAEHWHDHRAHEGLSGSSIEALWDAQRQQRACSAMEDHPCVLDWEHCWHQGHGCKGNGWLADELQRCIHTSSNVSLILLFFLTWLIIQVQTWSNVEGIQILGCVIYMGSLEAPRQAQGIFAGSLLCMELASERQTDISKLLDYLVMIIKQVWFIIGMVVNGSSSPRYKAANPAAPMPLPNFAMVQRPPYDPALELKPQESRCDHNHWVLPLILTHKFHKS